MSVTLPVSQSTRGWSNASALENIDAIVVTLLVFQLPMAPLNRVAPLKAWLRSVVSPSTSSSVALTRSRLAPWKYLPPLPSRSGPHWLMSTILVRSPPLANRQPLMVPVMVTS